MITLPTAPIRLHRTSIHLQLKSDETAQLLNKPYVNEVISRGHNLFLKFCQPLELLTYIGRGFRSFHAGNMGSEGQRAAKLPSANLENDSTLGELESGLTGSSGAGAKRQTFS